MTDLTMEPPSGDPPVFEQVQSKPAGVYAGWWERWLAQFIDGFVSLTAAVALLFLTIPLGLVADGTLAQALRIAAVGAAYLLYAPLMLAFAKGQTFGKKAMGARVVNADGSPIGLGRALIREIVLKNGIFTVLSVILVGFLNYLWAAWDDEKRTWHDMLVSTRVLRAAPTGSG